MPNYTISTRFEQLKKHYTSDERTGEKFKINCEDVTKQLCDINPLNVQNTDKQTTYTKLTHYCYVESLENQTLKQHLYVPMAQIETKLSKLSKNLHEDKAIQGLLAEANTVAIQINTAQLLKLALDDASEFPQKQKTKTKLQASINELESRLKNNKETLETLKDQNATVKLKTEDTEALEKILPPATEQSLRAKETAKLLNIQIESYNQEIALKQAELELLEKADSTPPLTQDEQKKITKAHQDAKNKAGKFGNAINQYLRNHTELLLNFKKAYLKDSEDQLVTNLKQVEEKIDDISKEYSSYYSLKGDKKVKKPRVLTDFFEPTNFFQKTKRAIGKITKTPAASAEVRQDFEQKHVGFSMTFNLDATGENWRVNQFGGHPPLQTADLQYLTYNDIQEVMKKNPECIEKIKYEHLDKNGEFTLKLRFKDHSEMGKFVKALKDKNEEKKKQIAATENNTNDPEATANKKKSKPANATKIGQPASVRGTTEKPSEEKKRRRSLDTTTYDGEEEKKDIPTNIPTRRNSAP
jgi:hypothetical protein